MTKHRIVGACLLLLVVPSLALAQRRGTQSPDWDQMSKSRPATSALSKKDVVEMDPVRHLIGNRKDLKLTDAQARQLKALETAGKKRDEPLFHTLDSLGNSMRSSGPMNDERRLRAEVVRLELTNVVAKIRANYDAAGTEALALLDERQRSAASALLLERSAAADRLLMEKRASAAPE